MEIRNEAQEEAPSAVARKRALTDLQTLTRDAEDLLKATAGEVSQKAQELRARVASALEHAKTTCVEMQEQPAAAAKAAAKKADIVIRQHPYESIGVAFGVGLLLGAVLARK